MIQETDREYWEGRLRKLEGKRVVFATMLYDPDYDDYVPFLEFDDHAQVMLVNDDDGSQPGRLAFVNVDRDTVSL